MTAEDLPFDAHHAHRYFAAHCFNSAWTLIEKHDRTPQEDEEMLRLAMASHYHWTQRGDYDPVSASVANWQLSRIYALLGQPDNARRYGERALEVLGDAPDRPFYLAYAHEALARAARLAGDRDALQRHLAAAREWTDRVEGSEGRQLLLQDLAELD